MSIRLIVSLICITIMHTSQLFNLWKANNAGHYYEKTQPYWQETKSSCVELVNPKLYVSFFYVNSYFKFLISIIICHNVQVQLPFSSLRPIFRAKTVADAQPFDPSQIISLQVFFLTVLVYFCFWVLILHKSKHLHACS